ncbi:hypothetical protein Harman_30090 [Haloarcula mannanilytica]|uniref:Uncharacterized protein n=2 Tax=Haloarcula mannanilytica TaxID=2509225 RepID=A0A4C2EKL5_9EURY|nr:hypothetical protein Harman_30090 [Haloarcula mannanilytica]
MHSRDQNETANVRTKEETPMKRRTVLAGVLPLLQAGQWLDRLSLVNQGKVVRKRLLGITDEGMTEIAVLDSDGATVSNEHEELLGQAPGEITTEAANSLGEAYDDLRFQTTVSHHGDGLSILGRTGTIEYQTSRALYSGIAVGDHISFQTSLLKADTIISLSCLTSERESLQHRCPVGVEDPTTDQ